MKIKAVAKIKVKKFRGSVSKMVAIANANGSNRIAKFEISKVIAARGMLAVLKSQKIIASTKSTLKRP